MKTYEAGEELNRIANALEEIIKMVKEDQERSRKYMEDRKDDWQRKKLAAHLAAMCCQADEDCPAEYRTEHFRSTMDDAYDYLKEIGYLKWVDNPGQQWPAYTCSTGDGSGIKDRATSAKPQAASDKPQAWQD